MEDNEQLKHKHEKTVAERFIEAYNKQNRCHFKIKCQREKPDFKCYDEQQNKVIGLEVTTAYLNNEIAKVGWGIARGKIGRPYFFSFWADYIKLAQFINTLVKQKCQIIPNYDFHHPVTLLVDVQSSPIENECDFRDNVLPRIKLPESIPCGEIYLGFSIILVEKYKVYRLYP